MSIIANEYPPTTVKFYSAEVTTSRNLMDNVSSFSPKFLTDRNAHINQYLFNSNTFTVFSKSILFILFQQSILFFGLLLLLNNLLWMLCHVSPYRFIWFSLLFFFF